MSNVTIPIAVGLGGFVGALSRYYISNAVAKAAGTDLHFMGTLAVNLIGCFCIGILATLVVRSTQDSPLIQKCIITGLLGSLTTFSTFALDTMGLIQSERSAAAIANVGLNLFAGLFLVWLGMQTAELLSTDPSTPT